MTAPTSQTDGTETGQESAKSTLVQDIGKLATDKPDTIVASQAEHQPANKFIKLLVNIWTSITGYWESFKGKGKSNRLIAIATVVIAFASGLTWWEAHDAGEQTDRIIAADHRIAAAMERAVSQANTSFKSTVDQFNIDQRAWIAPQNATLLSDLIPGEPFKLQIQYNNVGKEPALDVRPIYRITSIEGRHFTDNTFNSIVEGHNICDKVEIAPGADVVYPSQPGGNHLMLGMPKGWMTADIVNGRSALIVEMCFAYKTLGTVHRTAFCYFYRPGVSENGQLNVCTAGNHAD